MKATVAAFAALRLWPDTAAAEHVSPADAEAPRGGEDQSIHDAVCVVILKSESLVCRLRSVSHAAFVARQGTG